MKAAGGKVILVSYLFAKSAKADEFISISEDTGIKFMIDSGAYQFFNAKSRLSSTQEYEDYLRRYLDWCEERAQSIRCAVELDIYKIVGIRKVYEWQDKYLFPWQKRTGISVLPVWHELLGTDGWRRLLVHPGVTWAGIGSDHKMPVPHLRAFTKAAYDVAIKVHAFGLTRDKWLMQVPFYSADSSTWTVLPRYGAAMTLNKRVGRLTQIRKKRFGKGQISWPPKNKEELSEIITLTQDVTFANFDPKAKRKDQDDIARVSGISRFIEFSDLATKIWTQKGFTWKGFKKKRRAYLKKRSTGVQSSSSQVARIAS